MTSFGCIDRSLSQDRNGNVVTLAGGTVMAKLVAMIAAASSLPPHSRGCDLL